MLLTKSLYLKGLQCEKYLWLDQYEPDRAVETKNDSVLKNGTMVGELARQYFGEYSLVERNSNIHEMVRQTAAFMEQGIRCIAEAAFLKDDLFCAVDLLCRNREGWDSDL